MRLDIDSLKAFKSVVENGSFTLAANELFLTQSAVSWKLKRLEERLGCKLINRDGRNIQLTRHGQDLLTYARPILATHDAAVHRFSASELNDNIRLGATDYVTTKHLAEIAGQFNRLYPNIVLQIKVGQPLNLLDWLDKQRVDMAIVLLESSQIQADDIVLWEDQLVWIQSQDADFSHYSSVPFISFGEGCSFSEFGIQSLKQAELSFNKVMDCSSVAGVQAAVSAGMGITLINQRAVCDDHQLWEPNQTTLEPTPTITYAIRTNKDRMSNAQLALANEIQTQLCLQ